MHVSAQTFNEGFETGPKTSYATADVQLSTGLWTLNDALIGNLTTGSKDRCSIRSDSKHRQPHNGIDLSGAGNGFIANMQCLAPTEVRPGNCGNPLTVGIFIAR